VTAQIKGHASTRRRSVPLFVVCGVAIAVAAVLPTVWHQLHVGPELRQVDLDVYRSAGESVVIGRPVYGYLTAPPQLLPFTYPPVSAVLAVPLALIPWLAAQWIWEILQVALLGLVTAIAFRPAVQRFGAAAPIALGGAVAAMAWLLPIRDGIRFGQVDIMLLALCLVDCTARRTKWPHGALIGLATAVKLTPAVFVPYLWLTGRRREAGVAMATSVGLTLLVALLLPGDSIDYWTSALFNSDRLGSNTGTSNQSLRGMILRLSLPHALEVMLLVVAVTAVAVVGYRRARALSAAGDEVAAVTVVGLLAVLLSPVAWIHHLAWAVLAVGVLAGDLRNRKRLVAAVVTGLIYGLSVPWWGASILHNHHSVILGWPLQNAYGLAAIVLVATLPARRFDRTAQPAVPTPAPFAAAAAS
jgi:alpha-1,2-mannosyltransferase